MSLFQLYVYFGIFMVVLFRNRSGIFSIILLFSDWLFSSSRMFPIVSLNFLSQSIPSNGVMSFRSVISNCIFCLLFSYSISTGIFPRNFTSFLFMSCYRCLTFWISDSFNILLSAGIIDISEPVSTMNSFSVPLYFTVVGKYMFLTIILFTLPFLYMLDSDSSLSSPIRFSVSVTFCSLFL